MEHVIVNLKCAIRDNNPELTWAVLSNLEESLSSYVQLAHKEMINNPHTKQKKREGK